MWRKRRPSLLEESGGSRSDLFSKLARASRVRSFSQVLTRLVFSLINFGLIVGATYSAALAQVTTDITSDGSLGTTVTANASVHDITGGTRPGDGPGLFHSFNQFSVGAGNTANFLNDSGLPTTNILSRVTGGDPSKIFGAIQTTDFGQANLYLMNPAGVVFGPTASLNVGGSFHVTTADYLRFGEQEFFYADLAKDTVLSIAPPAAFGFLNEDPASITVDHSLFVRDRSLLEVIPGNDLSLIGGNLEIQGDAGSRDGQGEEVFSSLVAPSGQLALVSVLSPGELPFRSSSALPSGDVNSFEQLGEISSVGAGRLTTRGNPGGLVMIRAGKLVVIDTEISSTNLSENDHPGLGVDIEVHGDILLKGNLWGAAIGASSGLFGSADPFGKAGRVRIRSESLELVGNPNSFVNANIGSRAFGVREVAGDGGVVDITTERLVLGPISFIQTTTFGPAEAGSIQINADTFEVLGEQGFSFISTSSAGSGNAGALDLIANHILMQGGSGFTGLASQVRPDGDGSPNGAPIRITAHESLQLLDGAQISSGLFAGDGQGGGIEINTPSLVISGLDQNGFPAGIFSSVDFPANGTSGRIRIGSPDLPVTNLTLNNGGQITTSSFGRGRGGDVIIDAQLVTLAGPTTPPQPLTQSGIFSVGGFVAESAGDITVRSDTLDILDGAQVVARTGGMGPGGTIDIAADSMTISGTDPESGSFEGIRSGVYASSLLFPGGEDFAGGPAGNIILSLGSLDIGDQGTIQALSTTSGTAGTIEVNTGTLNLTEGASITAESTVDGNAGSIILSAEDSIQSAESSITTETNIGAGGSITIDANQLELTNTEISASVVDVPEGTDPNTGLGDITVTSQTMQVMGGNITAETTGTRAAGNITILGGPLELTEGARIEASTRGVGNAGSITVRSTGDVTVSGLSPNGQTRSGIFAKTQTSGGRGSGDGGGGSGSGNRAGGVSGTSGNGGGSGSGDSGSGSGGGGSGSGGGSGDSGGGSGSGAGSGSGTSGGSGGNTAGDAGDIAIFATNVLVLAGAQIDSSTTSGGDGGVMDIQATNTVTLAGSSTRLTSDATRGNGRGGDITVRAGDIFVRDGASVSAKTGGRGDAGAISLSAQNIVALQKGGTVSTSTSGSGKGGTISVDANSVLVDGARSSISADTLPPFADLTVALDILHPKDSDLTVQLDSPSGTRVALFSQVGGSGDNFTDTNLDDRASEDITAGSSPFTGTFRPREPLGQLFGEDASGTWTLNIRDRNTDNIGTLEGWTLSLGNQEFQADTGSTPIPDNGTLRVPLTVDADLVTTVQGAGDVTGHGGDITIHAGSVTLQNGGRFSATTRGSGKGGTVTVNVTDTLALSGSKSGIFTDSQASGSGGFIAVQAGQTALEAESTISAASAGSGAAGTITLISSNDFSISNSLVTSEAIEAAGGNVTIQAADDILLTNNSLINAQTSGPENAGNILIEAGNDIRLFDSTINAEATQADGGNIKLRAPEIIQLVNSQIISSVGGGASTVGGNISLDPKFIILQNSQILANAFGGQGGNISLVASNAVLVDPFSVLDASSALGVSGSVDIQAPIQNLSGTIAPLPEEAAPVSALYNARCAAGQDGHFSTFVDSKADSLSPTPGTFLASPLLFPKSKTPVIADKPQKQRKPTVLTASIVPLVLGHIGEAATEACQ